MEYVERKTLFARLLVAPPAMVFEELKAYSADVRASPFGSTNREMEAALAQRNDPLIDLGLATYGGDRDTVGAIYWKAKSPAENDNDKKYKKGVRLAVLGNETVSHVGFLRGFPEDTIGKEETVRVLLNADDDEAGILLANSGLDDHILLSLYRGKNWAADMDEDRRVMLVSLSSTNERLNTNKDNEFGPDMC